MDTALRPSSRADKGIKRGPRGKAGQPGITGEARKGGPNRPILPREGPERDKTLAAALQAYSEGFTLTEIAETHQVSKQAMRAWLLNEVPEQYHKTQTAGLLQRIAEADDGIDYALEHRDVIVLACAREQGKFARMDLERRRPHLYGQKQFIDQTVTVTVEASLTEDAKLLLNRIRGAVQQPVQVIDVTPQPKDESI